MHRIFVKDSVTGQCGLADPICPVSGDAGNLIQPGSDGGARLRCADLAACGFVTNSGVTQVVSTDPALVVTSPTGPSVSLDIVPAQLITPIAGNLLGVGGDGRLTAFETLTQLVRNANGTYTYFREDGTPATIVKGLPMFMTQYAWAESPAAPPLGTLFSSVAGAWPVRNETLVNPWPDMAVYVVITGRAYGSGWAGSSLLASIQATANGAILSDTLLQGNPADFGAGDLGLATAVSIPPGGSVNVAFQLDHIIVNDDGSTGINPAFTHSYILNWYREVLY